MTPQETRKPGYYHVKYDGDWEIGEWVNDEISGLHWELCGIVTDFYDTDFDEIDENQITRESLNGVFAAIWYFGNDEDEKPANDTTNKTL